MVAIGDARDGICEAIDKLHPRYLVIGSHGYGAFKRCDFLLYLFETFCWWILDFNVTNVMSTYLCMGHRTFLGSVSDYCAHHAKCPIVIVRKKD